MATYPYAQPLIGLDQIVAQMRKSVLRELNAGKLKSLGIAPNNESYIMNTLRSLGIFDADGKAVDSSLDAFYKSDDGEFAEAFASLVESAYSGLFELFGADAWTTEKSKLVNFFRNEDKSSALVGGRQADTFIRLAEIAKKREASTAAKAPSTNSARKPRQSPAHKPTIAHQAPKNDNVLHVAEEPEMALTVRIEINLPSGGDQGEYDKIFKSIRQHLIDRG